VSEFESWQVEPAIAGGLERLGWTHDAAEVRDVLPPVVRGTNVVAVLPPAPAWAGPIAAGVLHGVLNQRGRALVLTAPALVSEWGATFAALARDTDARIEAARGPSRAARRIKADALDVLIASPDTALNLLTRSSLDASRFTSVVFAWPEEWDADEAVTVLLQELPKDAQRVVITSRADHADALVERFARRALTFGVPSADPDAIRSPDTLPIEAARTLPVPWAGRAAAVAELIEATDPVTATIWTADTRDHAMLQSALGGHPEGIRVVCRTMAVEGSVICYDLPTLSVLHGFVGASDVTLLVPPGTEAHVARVVARRRPVQLATSSTALLARDAGLRAQVIARMNRGELEGALYALAPLFDRHEPQSVAAALFALWRGASVPATPAGVAAEPATPVGGVTTTKLWVGVGKKDEATVGDLVAVLVKEVGIDRTLVGRIELRDTFSLVEVPAAEAERIAQRMSGLTVRRRKLVARVDRGPGAPREGGFGGGRGGGGAPRGGFGAPRGERR
jgi:ATP-dependent RNA helicase DeaD